MCFVCTDPVRRSEINSCSTLGVYQLFCQDFLHCHMQKLLTSVTVSGYIFPSYPLVTPGVWHSSVVASAFALTSVFCPTGIQARKMNKKWSELIGC